MGVKVSQEDYNAGPVYCRLVKHERGRQNVREEEKWEWEWERRNREGNIPTNKRSDLFLAFFRKSDLKATSDALVALAQCFVQHGRNINHFKISEQQEAIETGQLPASFLHAVGSVNHSDKGSNKGKKGAKNSNGNSSNNNNKK